MGGGGDSTATSSNTIPLFRLLSDAACSRLILALLLCLETQYHLTKTESNLLIRMENMCMTLRRAKIYNLTWTGNRFPLVLAPALTVGTVGSVSAWTQVFGEAVHSLMVGQKSIFKGTGWKTCSICLILQGSDIRAPETAEWSCDLRLQSLSDLKKFSMMGL